jgi:tetratricopeptide (TPR) repeat protein
LIKFLFRKRKNIFPNVKIRIPYLFSKCHHRKEITLSVCDTLKINQMRKLAAHQLVITLCLSLYSFLATSQNTISYTDPSQHFRNGQEYFVSKNYVAARAEFSEFLDAHKPLLTKDDANTIWAEYYNTMCSLYLNYPDTELIADRFVRNHPEHPQAQSLFREIGQYFFDNKDYAKAVDYLGKTAGSDATSRFQLGVSHFQLQNYQDALGIFNDLKGAEGIDTDIMMGSAYYAAIINFRAARYKEAIPDFKIAEQSPTYRSEIPSWIAHSFYRQGKFTEMLAYTEMALREKNSGKKLEDIALLTAEVYFQQSNYPKAATYYSQYKNFKGQSMMPAIGYRFGYSLYKNNEFAQAADQLKGVAASSDTVGQYAAFIMGISYLKSNNPNYALGAFDQARKLNYNKAVKEDADFNYSKILLELGRGNEAIREIEKFLQTYPQSKYEDEANELVSEAYLSSNNYKAALEYIERLPRKSPRINAAYQRIAFNQGVKYYNEENYIDAQTFFNKSLSAPENPEVKYSASFWKAEALSAEKKYQEAIPMYQQLIASTDNTTKGLGEIQAKCRYGLAYAYYNTKEYDKANAQFKAFAERMKSQGDNQAYQDAVIRLGDTYFAAKNYPEAAKYYDIAIAGNKADKDYATYQKGVILVFQGNESAAKAAFQKVQNNFPDSRYADDAIFQEALLEFNASRYSAAITSFTQLINNKPKSFLVPQSLMKRALAFANTGNHEGAINDYKNIVKNYSTSKVAPDALEGLQQELNDAGRPEDFGQVLGDYQKSNPENTSTTGLEYSTATSLYFSEKYDKAIQALSDYIRKYPTSTDNYEAKYFIAESYNKLGDRFSAVRYYNQVIQENKYKASNRAAQKVADIEFAGKNYKNAITAYRSLLSLAADKRDQQTALIGLMESYYAINRNDSTIVICQQIINSGDVIAGAKSKANVYTGKIYQAQKEFVKATESYNAAIAIAKDELGAEAQYLICQILYIQKKYKESSDLILAKFRTDFEGASDKIIGKAYLLLSDDFIGLENTVQAKAILNSLIENSPEKEIVAEAKVKLSLIPKK